MIEIDASRQIYDDPEDRVRMSFIGDILKCDNIFAYLTDTREFYNIVYEIPLDTIDKVVINND